MTRAIPTLIVLLMASATVRAGPADEWLDRAEKNLREAMQAGGEPEIKFLADVNLGAHLVKLSGRDAHRDLLRQIAKDAERKSAAEKEVTREAGFAWDAADAWIVAGNRDDARRVLRGIDHRIDQVEAEGILKAFSVNVGRSTQLVMRARCDDLSPQQISELSIDELSSVCRNLAAFGERERQGPFVEAAMKASGKLNEDDRSGYRQWYEVLIAAGRGDEAIQRATRTPIGIRVDVLIGIAIRFQDRGDMASARRAAVAAWNATSQVSQSDRAFAQQSALGWLIEVQGPREMVSTGYEVLARRIEKLSGKRLANEHWAARTLVKAAHQLGRAEDRDQWLAKLEKVTAAQPADRRGEEWVGLAALAAEVGRLDSAERYLADARKEKKTEFSWLDATVVVQALASAGKFEQAEKLLHEILPEPKDRRIDVVRFAKARVRLGQYEAAMEATRKLPDASDRLRVRHAIVVHRVQKGKLEGLAKWIDTNPLPRERAALNLAVVEELLERRLEAYSLLLRVPK